MLIADDSEEGVKSSSQVIVEGHLKNQVLTDFAFHLSHITGLERADIVGLVKAFLSLFPGSQHVLLSLNMILTLAEQHL